MGRSLARTPGIVAAVKTLEAGSPVPTPSDTVYGAPPIDSYIVVRRNVPPTVKVCRPLSHVSVSERLKTGLLRGIGMTSAVGSGDVISGSSTRRPPWGS